MGTTSERMIAGALASLAFPALLAAVAGAQQGLIVIFLYAMPIYFTAGIAVSVVVDAVIGPWAGRGSLRGGAKYAAGLLLYGAAGCLIYIASAYMLFGRAAEPWAYAHAPTFGTSGALIYYHILLLVRYILNRSHRARFGQPVGTERLILYPCTQGRLEEARRRGYPIGKHIEAYMASLRRQPRLLGWGVWFVCLRGSGIVIGDAGFKGNPDVTGAVDIGYGFLPDYWGQGYATETAGALLEWAFAHGAGRVTAETLRDNAASIRVLRKNGFRLYREDEHYYWRIDASDWGKKGNGHGKTFLL